MPLILSGNVASAVAGAYEVANSCRFNDDDSAHMTKSSSAGVNDKGTLSVWIKRGNLGTDQNIYNPYTSSNTLLHIYFASDNTLKLYVYDNGSTIANLVTDAEYRDCSAWMHIVLAIDSDQGTSSNRMKLYVNGTQVTSFSSSGYPSSGADMQINNSGTTEVIGRYQDGTQKYFDGYMAEFVWIDGTQYAASDFGEFDEDSPTIWKPKDVSGLTFGTNGYYLDFEDSANLGNDANGGTDLTENNLAATDQATDTPTNNFATANPLNVNSGGVATFAEGNTEVTSPTATGMQFMSSSTLGMTAGKWYCEVKIKTVDSGLWGVSANVAEDARGDYPPGTQGGAQSVGLLGDNGNRYIDDGGATHGAGFSDDDIGMIALDLDNNNVYFGKNGSWFDGSGNADESSPNSAIAVTAVGSTAEGAYFFSCFDGGGSATAKVQWNFGNPPYANSSSVSDANGYGDFEYTVPSGYLALCTKNLGSDGG